MLNRTIELGNVYDKAEFLWWSSRDKPFCEWSLKNFVVKESDWNDWIAKNFEIQSYELEDIDIVERYIGWSKREKGIIFNCGVGKPREGEIEISFKLIWDMAYNEESKKIIKAIDKMCIIHKEKTEVYMLVKDDMDLDLRSFEINKPKIDLNLNYDDEWNTKHEYLLNQLELKEKKGIVLLHGLPGTGKTMYIRHLISILAEKRTVIYLPNQLIDSLTDPAFIPLLSEYNGSVIIIEDADEAIRSRKNGGASVDKLLNLADGILSDFLGIQFICTFNCPITTIDEALLRKGRLIFRHEFGKLPKAKAQKLSDSLGFDTEIKDDMTLAEIYNQEKRFGEDEKKQSRIGFK
jgi:hypothetical protein